MGETFFETDDFLCDFFAVKGEETGEVFGGGFEFVDVKMVGSLWGGGGVSGGVGGGLADYDADCRRLEESGGG